MEKHDNRGLDDFLTTNKVLPQSQSF